MPAFSNRRSVQRKRRAVRWQDTFDVAAKLLSQDPKTVDDLTAACVWRIEEDANGCDEVPNSPFRVAKAQTGPGEPVICILFTIDADDEHCDLWHVYVTEDPASSASATDDA